MPPSLPRPGLFAPLRHRDFRRLWGGQTLSLLGDGAFLVAMAWQVYALANAPAALALVGVAMTVPTIALLALGGALSDRLDRRQVLLAADAARAAAICALAVLSLAGVLALWEVVALVVVYGAGTAFFNPAFDAIVPELVPSAELAQANALDQFVRPIAQRLAGPALGGLLIGTLGAGAAFALDALTFAASGAAVLAMSPPARSPERAAASLLAEVGEGLRFVRAHVWLWGTLASAALAFLLFMGPVEVLLPYVVKNELHGGPGALGLVFAAGGLGAVLAALFLGQRGTPRRSITWMFVAWTLATLAVAGYGLAHAPWQLMVASLVFGGFEAAGLVIWATVKQRFVPPALLGRVSSLDWLVSTGLLPLSLLLTGPASAALGPRATLVAAGLTGAAVTLAGLFLPGVRAPEGERAAGEPEPLPQAAPRVLVEQIVLARDRSLREACEPRLARRLESIGLDTLADLRGEDPAALVARVDAAAGRPIRWTPRQLEALGALVEAADAARVGAPLAA